MRELSGRSRQIDKLTEGLSDFNDIFHQLCAIDPLASRTLVDSVRTVRQLLKGEIDSDRSLRSVYDQLGEATEVLEEAERQQEEKKRRLVNIMMILYTVISLSIRLPVDNQQ